MRGLLGRREISYTFDVRMIIARRLFDSYARGFQSKSSTWFRLVDDIRKFDFSLSPWTGNRYV